MAPHFYIAAASPNKTLGLCPQSSLCRMKRELNVTAKRGLWSKGVRALFTRCHGNVPEKGGVNGCIYWKWLLKYSSQSFHIWQAPTLVFGAIIFFFSSYEPAFSGSHSQRGRERWVCWSGAVVGPYSCSCCQKCGLFLLPIMCNTHEGPLHTGIDHLLITTCRIFMSGDFEPYMFLKKRRRRKGKEPSCLGINLRVRCHHCCHEPQV